MLLAYANFKKSIQKLFLGYPSTNQSAIKQQSTGSAQTWKMVHEDILRYISALTSACYQYIHSTLPLHSHPPCHKTGHIVSPYIHTIWFSYLLRRIKSVNKFIKFWKIRAIQSIESRKFPSKLFFSAKFPKADDIKWNWSFEISLDDNHKLNGMCVHSMLHLCQGQKLLQHSDRRSLEWRKHTPCISLLIICTLFNSILNVKIPFTTTLFKKMNL